MDNSRSAVTTSVNALRTYSQPSISNFNINPLESESEFTISWTITPEEKAKVGYYELWRSDNNGANWNKIGGKYKY